MGKMTGGRVKKVGHCLLISLIICIFEVIHHHYHHTLKNHLLMKRENLAKEIFPDVPPQAAVRRLRNCIRNCPELYAALTAAGRVFDRKRLLTQREVRLIRRYLC